MREIVCGYRFTIYREPYSPTELTRKGYTPFGYRHEKRRRSVIQLQRKTSEAALRPDEHAGSASLVGSIFCPRSARASRLDRGKLDSYATNPSGQAGEAMREQHEA